MSCFFFIGLYFPSSALASFFVLPLALSILYGYFIKDVKETMSIIIIGLILYGAITGILCGILSTLQPFWRHLENWPFLFPEITMFDEAFATIFILCLGFFALQIPLGVFGAFIGLSAEKLKKTLRTSEKRVLTYGDFTTEGMTKTGVMKVRIIGTIPKELYEWIKKEVESGNYVNQSHIIEAALKELKEKKHSTH
jgi:hypothetical protein